MKAFPTSGIHYTKDGVDMAQEGMELRDYFAAHALTGAQIWDAVLNGKHSVLAENGVDTLAEIAYAVADAMMEARKK